MARNKMSDLRNHLFETLEALRDEEKPMELARAKTISRVAQTIIETAKAEISLMKIMESAQPSPSGFFEAKPELEVAARRAIAAVKET